MLKKIMVLLLILLGITIAGYYLLKSQGAFQTKEEIYGKANASDAQMKCAAGKCGAAMEKMDSSTMPSKN